MSTLATFFITLSILLALAALLGVAILHAKLARAIDEKRASDQRAGMNAARLDPYS